MNAWAVLGAAGLRPTRQRAAILRALGRAGRPVTAQALHARLQRSGDGPGLATVYRTLQALAQAGLARTFPAGEGELAYKLCEPGHHHHLICEGCGLVVEIPSCEVEPWAARTARRRGFTVSSHQAEIFGRCAACAATA
ncbi:MAG TPA: Fur family transcriptional regulator [Actinomycetota bacterium]|nr:Fur family transcriptional regulator [Actinomycetota bacterium]